MLFVYDFVVIWFVPAKSEDVATTVGAMIIFALFLVWAGAITLFGFTAMFWTNLFRYLRVPYGLGVGRAATFLVDVLVTPTPARMPAGAHVLRVRSTEAAGRPLLARVRGRLATRTLYHSTLYTRREVLDGLTAWVGSTILAEQPAPAERVAVARCVESGL